MMYDINISLNREGKMLPSAAEAENFQRQIKVSHFICRWIQIFLNMLQSSLKTLPLYHIAPLHPSEIPQKNPNNLYYSLSEKLDSNI